jgi:hypothetical protein
MSEINATPVSSTSPLAEELLRGAGAIAVFVYGDFGERRKVYNLVEQQSLPVFRLGRTICARKSTLRAWVVEQEKAGCASFAEEQPTREG